MKHRGERLQVMLDPHELKAVDDWRYDKECPAAPRRCAN